MLKEAFQDLNRLRQIAQIAARHGFGELLERAGVWRLVGGKARVEPTPEAREASTARRFRLLLGELGPTFVKLGQILSTRSDLLPAAYIEELSHLQDDVPPFPLEQVHAQILAALGRPAKVLFESIDETPLAAASIAQVHRGVTLDGQEVAIKVQRPGIADRIRSDVSFLRSLARLLEASVEETGVYSPTSIVDEFERAIHEELDFGIEADNVRTFHQTHTNRPDIVIPRVHEELSARTVLTLELLHGVKLQHARLTHDERVALAGKVLDEAFRQVFEDGVFHADPHPGNVLLLADGRIALLDFGLVGRIGRGMQESLMMLVVAVALKDADSLARLLYRMGSDGHRTQLNELRREIEELIGRFKIKSLGAIDAPAVVRELFDLAVRHHIKVPKDYALLGRSSVALEGILRGLDPDLQIADVALPYAKQLLADRYDPAQLQGGLLRTLFRLQGLASDLPVQISQILLDLEHGRLPIEIRSPQLDRLHDSLRSAAVIAFMGLCACGFIVGAFISFAGHPWMVRGVPVLGVLGIALAAALFGAAITWYLFAGRIRKVQLRRFVGRKRG